MKDLKEKLGNVSLFDSIIASKALLSNDLNSPSYLEAQIWGAYLAYVKQNISLVEEILIPFENISFDGNYDRWTWIESGLVLNLRIDRLKGEINRSNLLKTRILDTLDFGNEEMKNKIKKKAFNRRLSGELLSLDKIEKAKLENKKELELMYLLSNLKELMFIREFNNDITYTDIELETLIQATIGRTKEIIASK